MTALRGSLGVMFAGNAVAVAVLTEARPSGVAARRMLTLAAFDTAAFGAIFLAALVHLRRGVGAS